MITASGIKKSFGSKTVFNGADITVDDGSICGLVGINGAGKSTLLRILCGVLTADGGAAQIDGKEIFDNPEVKRGIFFLADEPFFEYGLTCAKLCEFYKTVYDFDEAVFRKYTDKFGSELKKPIRNFSKGMKRQVYIAAAFACKPKYLFLDEAFDGLDPLSRLEFKRGIIELQEGGTTVIIASHSLRELEDICDSFILIDNMTVKVCGKIEDALDNIVKLQVVFSTEMEEKDMPFPCMRFTRVGRVVTVVARGGKDELTAKLEKMNPLIIDEVGMDFEDYFIEEVRSGVKQ
ncbi:MAG: ABC transporter ATP-binding protein [Clostridiales bacterium]|nr:ABC transporter ATP-binding protein [Clostridiales bacterium]